MRRVVDIPPARIGHGDAEHAARGVGPAQDYPCPIGTPVYAPFDVVRLERLGGRDADGGLELRGYAANGDWFSAQHLSAYLYRPEGAQEAAQVALSGNTGTKTTGAHVHVYYVIGGVRINPEKAIAAAPASLPAQRPTGGKMVIYARRDDGLIVAIPEGGKVYPFPSVKEYEATRDIVAFINGQRQKHGQPLVTLPPSVPELVAEATMSAANINHLIHSQGAYS